MVRPQPPGPEITHRIDEHNLDFVGRSVLKHFLSNVHNHDQLVDLVNSTDDFINYYNDQHDVYLNNQYLPVLKESASEVVQDYSINGKFGASGAPNQSYIPVFCQRPITFPSVSSK
jgi:hypothetical protein